MLATQDFRHIEVTPHIHGFGAQVTGLDLSQPLPAEVQEEVKAAWAEHAVLAFPDQPLSLEQLEDFTRQLGEFGHDPFIKPMAEHPHVLELRREPDETASNFGSGWHSDWSFQEEPPAGTILHSEVIPPVGGNTLYADTTRAYETLSAEMKERIEGLQAIHSAMLPYGRKGVYSQDKVKRTMEIIVSKEAEVSQTHPIVRTHPVTGRKSLFISPVYTIGVEGLDDEKAQGLLGELYIHMTKEEFVYRHKWQPDMLVIWDNRNTMHFAEGGYDGHLRVLHRTTIAGEVPV